MYGNFKNHLQAQITEIEENGLFKKERVITTPQGASVKVNNQEVIIFCANKYLCVHTLEIKVILFGNIQTYPNNVQVI